MSPSNPAHVEKARCISCRTEIEVLPRYAHGDQIKCGACETQHRVTRNNDVLRLVLADVAALKETVYAGRARIRALESELTSAQGSIGLGINGFGLGLVYIVWQIARKDRLPELELLWEALVVSLVSGILLELANYLFLAKRQRISRVSETLSEARADLKEMEKRLREASRA